jgi:hypothetical protein
MLPYNPSSTLFTDGDHGRNNFYNGVQSVPHNSPGWDTWNSGPVAPVGRWINLSGTVGATTTCVMGYTNTSTTYYAGAYRTDAASGGDCVSQLINYGDIATNQGTGTRQEHLVNLLCMGNMASPFNPDYQPRAIVSQETFDPSNNWNGTAKFSADDPSVSIGSPNWRNNATEGWSSPPHYGWDFSYGPTYNGMFPYDDTWTIEDTSGGNYNFGDDAGDGDGGRSIFYSNYMDSPPYNDSHWDGSYWRSGGYNNKVGVAGPFDFSDTSYFSADPVMYVRVYHRVFSAYWLSLLWIGWDDSATPPGWTGDPLTPSGVGGTGLFAPAWNYNQLIGYGQPQVGTGTDLGLAIEGQLIEVPLTGAAGQSNVYVTFCLHSSESLGSTFSHQSQFLDGFTICTGDSGTAPPAGV